jgi:hypothetical protein
MNTKAKRITAKTPVRIKIYPEVFKKCNSDLEESKKFIEEMQKKLEISKCRMTRLVTNSSTNLLATELIAISLHMEVPMEKIISHGMSNE